MAVIIVSVVLITVALYLLAGAIFSIFFLARGLKKIDEGTHGSTVGFRIIIIPGCIVFWPLLLRKWLNAIKKNNEPG